MNRRKNNEEKMKRLVYVFSIVLFISIIVFISLFSAYNKKLKEEANIELSRISKESEIVDNKELEKIKETSYSEDLTVKNTNTDTLNNSINTNIVKKNNKNENVQEENTIKTSTSNNSNNVSSIIDNSKKNNENSSEINNNNTLETNSLNFIAPVSGEIIKDFSADTLVYSNTLKEWTTHNGIDIKAAKTSVVAASEKGIVESIKNDPRYGLTITIVHEDGYKTIYSNLLTTEFVKENETVERGQTIATVGESASFEVADEPHLHFEMYKDGENINPTIYLKDV